LIQTRLNKEVDEKIKLIVRSVVGTDMDENGFVIPEEIPLSDTTEPVAIP